MVMGVDEWREAVLVGLRGLRADLSSYHEDLVGLLAPVPVLSEGQRVRFEDAAARALAVRRSELEPVCGCGHVLVDHRGTPAGFHAGPCAHEDGCGGFVDAARPPSADEEGPAPEWTVPVVEVPQMPDGVVALVDLGRVVTLPSGEHRMVEPPPVWVHPSDDLVAVLRQRGDARVTLASDPMDPTPAVDALMGQARQKGFDEGRAHGLSSTLTRGLVEELDRRVASSIPAAVEALNALMGRVEVGRLVEACRARGRDLIGTGPVSWSAFTGWLRAEAAAARADKDWAGGQDHPDALEQMADRVDGLVAAAGAYVELSEKATGWSPRFRDAHDDLRRAVADPADEPVVAPRPIKDSPQA